MVKNTHQSKSFVRGFFLAGILCARAVNLRRCGGSRGASAFTAGVGMLFAFSPKRLVRENPKNATRTTARAARYVATTVPRAMLSAGA